MKHPKPPPPAGRNDEKFTQLMALRELINLMSHFSAPAGAVLPPGRGSPDKLPAAYTVPGTTVRLTTPPDQLAEDSARSAIAIAHAAAGLGLPPAKDARGKLQDDTTRATTLWRETLAQIGRVQQLYGLGPLPFQSQPLPAPKTGA